MGKDGMMEGGKMRKWKIGRVEGWKNGWRENKFERKNIETLTCQV